MILAGDIGGTKCNLALFEVQAKSRRKIAEHRYESREFPTFDEVITKFLSIPGRPRKTPVQKRLKPRVLALPDR